MINKKDLYEKELMAIQSSVPNLRFVNGIFKGILGWLTLIGNLILLTQLLTSLKSVLFNQGEISRLVFFIIFWGVFSLCSYIFIFSSNHRKLWSFHSYFFSILFAIFFIKTISLLIFGEQLLISINPIKEGPLAEEIYPFAIVLGLLTATLFICLKVSEPKAYENCLKISLFIFMTSIIVGIYLGVPDHFLKMFHSDINDLTAKLVSIFILIIVYIKLLKPSLLEKDENIEESTENA